MKEIDPRHWKLSRRKFIEVTAKGSAGIGLSHAVAPMALFHSCSPETEKTVHGACYHDCPDTCSWTVTTSGKRMTRFEASKTNPFTNGMLCSKMTNFPADVTFHPDRVMTPLKRSGEKGSGTFTPISWEKAMGEVAEKLQSIIRDSGGEAILPYSFAGTEGLVQKNSLSARFFKHIGASQLERTICGDAAVAGVVAANGQTTGVLPEDIVHSRYILFWGTNPAVSNQHLWVLAEKARQQGAKIVVVDPFESQTAKLADWHIQPLPGTDTVLALGMMHVILAEDLHDHHYIEKYTLGFEKLRNHVQQYDPAYVATITGIDEKTLLTLAREYAAGSPSLIRVLIGMEHHVNGASAFRAVAMLPALTGAWQARGGGLMHMTYELFGQALNWEPLNLADGIGSADTRMVNMIQIGRALNDPALAPPIQALVVYNSNPAVIAPDQNQVIKGLKREDLLTVVIEHFMTDTARYADYIFPATSQLEHWDLLTSWGQGYININQPAISPRGQARTNTEFFRLLAKEMGFTEPYLFTADLEIIRELLRSDHPFLKGISFESLVETGWARLKVPEPWLPHAEGNFGTASGKCEFYNEALQPPLPEYHPVAYSPEIQQAYPIRLLTIKSTKNFLNSSHANVGHLLKKEGPPYLDLHPEDAQARNIREGDEVKVYNQKGVVTLAARVNEKVRAGVACMPQGYWPSLLKGGSSANALTPDLLTDWGRGAALQETRVQVERI